MDFVSPEPSAVVAHLSIALDESGGLLFFPEGDPERVAEALGILVEALHGHPQRIACASGACTGHLPHEMEPADEGGWVDEGGEL